MSGGIKRKTGPKIVLDIGSTLAHPQLNNGAQLETPDDGTFQPAQHEEVFFAHVALESKLQIVGALQAMDQIVAQRLGVHTILPLPGVSTASLNHNCSASAQSQFRQSRYRTLWVHRHFP